MKKIVTVLFCTLLVSVNSFAEFVISPKIGYSNISTLEPQKQEEFQFGEKKDSAIILHRNSWNTFVISADMGFIGKKGFTFLFNTNISLLGSMQKKASASYISTADGIDIKFKNIKGAYGNGELLFGYTFKQPNLYVTLAGGLGIGGTWNTIPKKIEAEGKTVDTKELFEIGGFNMGIALHVSATYYFTKNIGLGFSLTDTPGYGFFHVALNEKKAGVLATLINNKGLDGGGGFSNVFSLKLGPVFKF